MMRLHVFVFFESVGPDLCHAGFVAAFEYDTRASHHCVFQHVICLFTRAIKISTSLDRTAQQLM